MSPPTVSRRRRLVVAAVAQLAVGLAGQAVALRRRLAYDVALLGWRGGPGRVGLDSWSMGTALSAPVPMLAAQGVAVARLAAGPSPGATRTLGVLGGVMVGGYLVERTVRRRLRPSGWDLVETPVAVAGLALSAAMVVLARAEWVVTDSHGDRSELPTAQS